MSAESLPTFTKPARQRWESIPADIRQRLLSKVWCGQCRHETTITKFTGTRSEYVRERIRRDQDRLQLRRVRHSDAHAHPFMA